MSRRPNVSSAASPARSRSRRDARVADELERAGAEPLDLRRRLGALVEGEPDDVRARAGERKGDCLADPLEAPVTTAQRPVRSKREPLIGADLTPAVRAPTLRESTLKALRPPNAGARSPVGPETGPGIEVLPRLRSPPARTARRGSSHALPSSEADFPIRSQGVPRPRASAVDPHRDQLHLLWVDADKSRRRRRASVPFSSATKSAFWPPSAASATHSRQVLVGLPHHVVVPCGEEVRVVTEHPQSRRTPAPPLVGADAPIRDVTSVRGPLHWLRLQASARRASALAGSRGEHSAVGPSQQPILNWQRGHCSVAWRHSIAVPQRQHGSAALGSDGAAAAVSRGVVASGPSMSGGR